MANIKERDAAVTATHNMSVGSKQKVMLVGTHALTIHADSMD